MKIGQYLVKLRARVRCLVFLTHSVGAKFYCPRALDGSNQHIQISEKMLEFSSTLDNVIYDVSVAVIYTVGWAAGRAPSL